MEQFLPESPGLIHNGFPLLGPVGYAEKGYACTGEIVDCGLCIVKHHLREQTRAGVENVNFVHICVS